MNHPRWPPLVMRADDDQIVLAVDCKDPLCMRGWQEVILFVRGLDRDEVRARLAEAARDRAYCDRHARPLRTLV